jgi:hypothetical protein
MTRDGEREDERTGARVSDASPNHGGVTELDRTRASRIGVEADSVRVRRLGKSSGLRARASPIRSQGAWRVDGFSLNRRSKVAHLARESKPDVSRKAHGRSWRRGYGPRRRCSRVTRALRDRIDREGLYQRVSRLRARYREESRHPRRGAPKCGARVVGENRASDLREVVAGREARNHGVHHASNRSKRASSVATRFIWVNSPAPSTAPSPRER